MAVPLTVAQTLRYNGVIKGLKKHLPAMGKVFSLAATHRLEPSDLPWLEQPEIAGGGVIFHTAVHLFDALRFITGEEIVKIRATARHVYNQGLKDLLVAEVVLGNGSLGILDASKVSPARAGRYEFVGEQGQLQGDQIHGILQKIEGARIASATKRRQWFFLLLPLKIALIAALFFPNFTTQNFVIPGFRNLNNEGFMGISDVFLGSRISHEVGSECLRV